MSNAGNRIKEGLQEAVAFAKGDAPAARIIVNGHAYVPADRIEALEAEVVRLREGRDGFLRGRAKAAMEIVRREARAKALEEALREMVEEFQGSSDRTDGTQSDERKRVLAAARRALAQKE